ncbi:zinc finger protein 2-like [Embiotoca jacksoni]|uniref:zinc finger protein 2-like n=1 Tax=Embiotoca jacksoni TaxID=100190 RepID=UPI0037042568
MSSVQYLRELINDRLTAAAEEIFGIFAETIVQYEEEIDRQRRLLDITWKPEIKLHRTDVPQQHVFWEEEVLSDQQLWNQERNSSLDEEEPELPQIKDEQEELCISLDGEQLVLKQETEAFMVTPTDEESDRGDRLLSRSSPVAESRGRRGSRRENSGSARKAKPKPKKRRLRNRNQRTQRNRNKGDDSPASESHGDADARNNSLKCTVCGRVFKYMSDVKRHLKIHTGERPFPCNTCGRRFFMKQHLKAHIRTHTGERPYTCKICDKSFGQSSALSVHTRTHTGERPYACDTCGKRFFLQQHLNAHTRTHTGERPFSCKICSKSFSQLSVLSNHMGTHTGERPYTCNTCGKRYYRPSLLKSHMRTHAGRKSKS